MKLKFMMRYTKEIQYEFHWAPPLVAEEKLVLTAVRHTGCVYGGRPNQIHSSIEEANGLYCPEEDDHGYITNHGRYLTREEAYHLHRPSEDPSSLESVSFRSRSPEMEAGFYDDYQFLPRKTA
jgi:hypothetical protein